MAGYVVDVAEAPEVLDGDNNAVFSPAPNQTYYILSANGVEQPGLDAYATYDEALYVANANNEGLDEIDAREWDVVAKVAPPAPDNNGVPVDEDGF